MRPTIRLLFAIAAAIAGIYILIKSGGSNVEVATGIGIILAAIATVAP